MIKRERGRGGGPKFVRGNYKYFKGINLTVLVRIHRFIIGGVGGGGGAGGAAQSVRGNYTLFKAINVTVLERRPHNYILGRTTSE